MTELREEDMEISPEVLAGLSPYRTAHINRFGDYAVDMTREMVPMDFTRPSCPRQRCCPRPMRA